MPGTATISAIHLSPADGWFAAYATASEPHLELKRLISFAVVEKTSGGLKVDGVDSDLTLCFERSQYDEDAKRWSLPHCLGFYHKEDLTDKLRAQLTKTAQAYGK